MASFFADLWTSVFTPGATPTLLLATNVTFATLQVLLFALLIATYSVHFAILSVLSGGLWYAINWFAVEVKAAQEAESRAEKLRRRTNDEARGGGGDADDEGEDTEVDDVRESASSVTGAGNGSGGGAQGLASGAQPGVSSATDVKTRLRRQEDMSRSEMSTDSEWEEVSHEASS